MCVLVRACAHACVRACSCVRVCVCVCVRACVCTYNVVHICTDVLLIFSFAFGLFCFLMSQIAQALPDVFSFQKYCDEAQGAQMISSGENMRLRFSCRLQL